MKNPAISVLDLVTLRASQTHQEAMAQSIDLARHLDVLGYNRVWYAEHHNVGVFTCCTPAIMIGHAASVTKRIRVGAGGVMLLNHSPLVVAEQFGTLERLHPGRIDLGLGRANGSSAAQTELMNRVLRRYPNNNQDSFEERLTELRSYFAPPEEGQQVKAGPAQGADTSLFILGSSIASAQVAGKFGLPFTFALQIAPDKLAEALAIYRHSFQPSEVLTQPYVMISVPAVAAETDHDAAHCFTSFQQLYLATIRDMIQGRNSEVRIEPPVDSMRDLWSSEEEELLNRRLRHTIVGGRHTVSNSIKKLVNETQADELMFVSEIYDFDDRLRSYKVLAEAVAHSI